MIGITGGRAIVQAEMARAASRLYCHVFIIHLPDNSWQNYTFSRKELVLAGLSVIQ